MSHTLHTKRCVKKQGATINLLIILYSADGSSIAISQDPTDISQYLGTSLPTTLKFSVTFNMFMCMPFQLSKGQGLVVRERDSAIVIFSTVVKMLQKL